MSNTKLELPLTISLHDNEDKVGLLTKDFRDRVKTLLTKEWGGGLEPIGDGKHPAATALKRAAEEYFATVAAWIYASRDLELDYEKAKALIDEFMSIRVTFYE